MLSYTAPLATVQQVLQKYAPPVNKNVHVARVLQHFAKRPYVIPTVIYPRPANKLPPVMLPEEIMKIIDGVGNLKHRTF